MNVFEYPLEKSNNFEFGRGGRSKNKGLKKGGKTSASKSPSKNWNKKDKDKYYGQQQQQQYYGQQQQQQQQYGPPGQPQGPPGRMHGAQMRIPKMGKLGDAPELRTCKKCKQTAITKIKYKL